VRIGIPTEVKNNEFRVAMPPASVRELVLSGHAVYVQSGAGTGSSIPDDDYVGAGAKIIENADDLWGEVELVCKVKEPIEEEFHRLRPDLVLFTYLHLAASRSCTDAILSSKTTAIAYETVQLSDGSLPLLAPMSEVAGRMAPMVGARHLMRPFGGRGVLMSGVPGVEPARVAVIGAGVAGSSATAVAVGMHSDVVVLDRDVPRLRNLDNVYAGRVRTVAASAQTIEEACLDADLVIGAVLVPGARAPRLVCDDLVSRMKPGSVLVDISIDQGGCFQSSRPTTHDQPTFPVERSIFYCVANMPGAVPHSSTRALANATLAYVMEIATFGWREGARRDRALASGVNAVGGSLMNGPVAEAHGLPSAELNSVLW
jgi:alanine dehydrogenase